MAGGLAIRGQPVRAPGIRVPGLLIYLPECMGPRGSRYASVACSAWPPSFKARSRLRSCDGHNVAGCHAIVNSWVAYRPWFTAWEGPPPNCRWRGNLCSCCHSECGQGEEGLVPSACISSPPPFTPPSLSSLRLPELGSWNMVKAAACIRCPACAETPWRPRLANGCIGGCISWPYSLEPICLAQADLGAKHSPNSSTLSWHLLHDAGHFQANSRRCVLIHLRRFS